MSDDIADDPEFTAWQEETEKNLVPKIDKSAATVTLVPRGPTDVKFAVELGLSIMMDKPIIAVVAPGVQLPTKLAKVADYIVEGDVADPAFQDRLKVALDHVLGTGATRKATD